MKNRHRYLIEQALDDTLSSNEREELDRLLRDHPHLQRHLHEEQAVHTLMSQSAPDAFEDGFAERTMSRLNRELMTAEEHAPASGSASPTVWGELTAGMELLLRRFGAVPASAVLALALYNVYAGPPLEATSTTLVERLFGLPPIAVELLLAL
ncbi:hypothetical protein CRI93_13840 [Longimonas halophila]|uniref:Zinc-finger domain-containing protein n=1 Tax=Longimonas halophila TaxID=1469170 RepID=A0A2H3NIB9_9BACT|nr:hypothetical protein [Longimonas halophila]PEN05095.1 hypothetical protein CRI93_13840 [Longimonas halophila]